MKIRIQPLREPLGQMADYGFYIETQVVETGYKPDDEPFTYYMNGKPYQTKSELIRYLKWTPCHDQYIFDQLEAGDFCSWYMEVFFYEPKVFVIEIDSSTKFVTRAYTEGHLESGYSFIDTKEPKYSCYTIKDMFTELNKLRNKQKDRMNKRIRKNVDN